MFILFGTSILLFVQGIDMKSIVIILRKLFIAVLVLICIRSMIILICSQNHRYYCQNCEFHIYQNVYDLFMRSMYIIFTSAFTKNSSVALLKIQNAYACCLKDFYMIFEQNYSSENRFTDSNDINGDNICDGRLINLFYITVIASAITSIHVMLINDSGNIIINHVYAVVFAVIMDKKLLVMTALIITTAVLIGMYLEQSICCAFREISILLLFDCIISTYKSKISFIQIVVTISYTCVVRFIKINVTPIKTTNVILAQQFVSITHMIEFCCEAVDILFGAMYVENVNNEISNLTRTNAVLARIATVYLINLTRFTALIVLMLLVTMVVFLVRFYGLIKWVVLKILHIYNYKATTVVMLYILIEILLFCNFTKYVFLLAMLTNLAAIWYMCNVKQVYFSTLNNIENVILGDEVILSYTMSIYQVISIKFILGIIGNSANGKIIVYFHLLKAIMHCCNIIVIYLKIIIVLSNLFNLMVTLHRTNDTTIGRCHSKVSIRYIYSTEYVIELSAMFYDLQSLFAVLNTQIIIKFDTLSNVAINSKIIRRDVEIAANALFCFDCNSIQLISIDKVLTMVEITFKLLVWLKLKEKVKNLAKIPIQFCISNYEQFDNTIDLVATIQFDLNGGNITLISRLAIDIIDSSVWVSFANHATQWELVAVARGNNLSIISIKLTHFRSALKLFSLLFFNTCVGGLQLFFITVLTWITIIITIFTLKLQILGFLQSLIVCFLHFVCLNSVSTNENSMINSQSLNHSNIVSRYSHSIGNSNRKKSVVLLLIQTIGKYNIHGRHINIRNNSMSNNLNQNPNLNRETNHSTNRVKKSQTTQNEVKENGININIANDDNDGNMSSASYDHALLIPSSRQILIFSVSANDTHDIKRVHARANITSSIISLSNAALPYLHCHHYNYGNCGNCLRVNINPIGNGWIGAAVKSEIDIGANLNVINVTNVS